MPRRTPAPRRTPDLRRPLLFWLVVLLAFGTLAAGTVRLSLLGGG